MPIRITGTWGGTEFTRARDMKKHEILPCYRAPETFRGALGALDLLILNRHIAWTTGGASGNLKYRTL